MSEHKWYRVTATVDIRVEVSDGANEDRLSERLALDEVAIILAREALRRRDEGEHPIRYGVRQKGRLLTREEAGTLR